MRTILAFTIVLLFTVQCSTKDRDYCEDHDFGQTTLRGRVLDSLTKKPIDSVEIRIVSGPSWDHFLDTIVKQNDTLSFTFNAADDCDPYFYTLSNKHYWIDQQHHPAYNVSITKGAINNFEIHLKPATFFEINVKRDTSDKKPEAVLLELRKVNTKEWQRWANISADDFAERPDDYIGTRYAFSDSGSYRTISAYYDIESNANYDVRWILANTKLPDTLYNRFTAEPFDTIRLNYIFREKLK